jgi:hypothetical protein
VSPLLFSGIVASVIVTTSDLPVSTLSGNTNQDGGEPIGSGLPLVAK